MSLSAFLVSLALATSPGGDTATTPSEDMSASSDAADAPSAFALQFGAAFSLTSFGPRTFALSDMLHVNRILYAWPELRGGVRYALPLGFGLSAEAQVGHTSVGQGNSIVGERLYLVRAATVGAADYTADFDGRSLIGGVRVGATLRAAVNGGVRALGAVDIGRVSPVFSASLSSGPRVALLWPSVAIVLDAFLGYGLEGPVSGGGMGILWHYDI